MRVRLSVKKCTVIAQRIQYCGRVISSSGFNYEAKYYDKILNMKRPRYKSELAQAYHIAGWLSPAIYDLARVRDQLLPHIGAPGTRAKDLAKSRAEVQWTEDLLRAWEMFKKSVANAAKVGLETYNNQDDLILVTDASSMYWSAAVMQVKRGEGGKPLQEIRPTPLCFISGKFSPTECRWHVSQKEIFPVIQAFKKLRFLLMGHLDKIYCYTDHANLVSLLRPTWGNKPGQVDRLRRWSLLLQDAAIAMIHVPGKHNVLADCLTRWGILEGAHQGSGDPDCVVSTCKDAGVEETRCGQGLLEEMNARATNTITPAKIGALTEKSYRIAAADMEVDSDIEESDIESIIPESEDEDEVGENAVGDDSAAQVQAKLTHGNRPEDQAAHEWDGVSYRSPLFASDWKRIDKKQILEVQKDAGQGDGVALVIKKQGIWIPKDLSERFLVHNHIVSEHMSLSAELAALKPYHVELKSGTLRQIVKGIRRKCLHCEPRARLFSRPMDISSLATKPREIILMDWLYINPRGSILVITDAFTRKTFLHHAKKPNAEESVKGLRLFRAALGLEEKFLVITDRASYFCSKMLLEMERAFGSRHSYALSYTPWTNGAIEGSNPRILRLLRTMLSEYALTADYWIELLPEITYLLNNSPLPSREGRTADELFLGLKAPSMKALGVNMSLWIDKKRREPRSMKVLQNAVDAFRKEIDSQRDKLTKHIKKQKQDSNARKSRGAKLVQFGPGQYVMSTIWGTPKQNRKYALRWQGPWRIEEVVAPNVYRCRNIYGKHRTIHAALLYWYENQDYQPSKAAEAAAVYNLHELVVKRFLDISLRKGEYMIKTQWLGFHSTDATWEPLKTMYEDLPEMVEKFVHSYKGFNKSDKEKFARIFAGYADQEMAAFDIVSECDAMEVDVSALEVLMATFSGIQKPRTP